VDNIRWERARVGRGEATLGLHLGCKIPAQRRDVRKSNLGFSTPGPPFHSHHPCRGVNLCGDIDSRRDDLIMVKDCPTRSICHYRVILDLASLLAGALSTTTRQEL
jgi:hypothetical protein